jgi:2'-5' RNA ligase
MAKELMWVCALLPDEMNRKLVDICRRENRNIGLPEDVFRFPLHISMKKSFRTTEFDKVKSDIISHIKERGKIKCRIGTVVCHNKMLWLSVSAEAPIMEWHNRLDQQLLEKYDIPIDRFDAKFQPHVSLFTRGADDKIAEMQKALACKISPMEFSLGHFVVGASGHKDEFINI